MSGECKSYRLNEPMNWKEFKAMPDDIKVTYIKLLREKFDVPDCEIYRMFGTDKDTLSRFFKVLGLRLPRRAVNREWKKDEWFAWVNGVDIETIKTEDHFVDDPEIPLPCPDEFHCNPNQTSKDNDATEAFEEPEPPEEPKAIQKHIAEVGKKVEQKSAVPIRGELTFCGSAEDALKTAAVLLGGANVQISLSWEVIADEE